MSRLVWILVVILVAGIISTDTVAQEPSRELPNRSPFSLTSPKTFKEIGFLTKARFAAQAIIAPKSLGAVVPLYVYDIETLNRESNNSRPWYWKKGFTAIVCKPNSETEYTGFPIVSAEPNASAEQKSQLAYKDIQGLIEIVADDSTEHTPESNPTDRGDAANQFRNWQEQYCGQHVGQLLIGTSYPIPGVDEATRLWTKKNDWNSRDTVLKLDFTDRKEETRPAQPTHQPPQ